MRKHFILAAMAISALFTACSNDDDSTPLNEGQVPVSFTIGGIDSRATTSATDFSTTFENGDAIGISGSNVTPTMDNVKYNVTVTGGSTSIETEASNNFTYGEADAIFNAYYPYAENFSNTFAVQENQTGGISNSDFLTATAMGTATNPNVTLEFSHRLVLVQVKLSGVSNVNSVILKNAKTKVIYTASTSSVTESTVELVTEDNEARDIIMWPQTANSTYWAIIPAQTIDAGSLIEVNAAEGTFSYTTTTSSTFTEGSLVKYSLTVSGSQEDAKLVTFQPVSTKAWANTDDEIEGNLEKEIFNLKAEIPTSNDKYTNVNGNRAALTGDTPAWGYNFQDSSEGTVTYNNDKGAIQSTLTTAPNSYNWAKTALFYYSGKNKIKSDKKYKLSFEAWVEDNTTITDNKVLVTVSSSTGFYALNTGNTGAQTITLNATKTTKYTFIFSDKFYTSNSIGSSMNNTFDETAPIENSIYVGIAPQTLNTYYITNLIIEEVIEEN